MKILDEDFNRAAMGLLEDGPQTEESGESLGTENVNGGLPTFPEIGWRGAFADYRQAVKNSTEAADALHFGALWAAAAVTLKRNVWMYSGVRVYPSVYINLVGPTADKKTTAQRMVTQCGIFPPEVRIVRNQGSTEGLADSLRRDDGGACVALLMWEEITGLLARGRWSGSTILEFVTETFDCPSKWGLAYRKNAVELTEPTPTILAGTTAEWFWKNARPDDFYGGFGNRFFYLSGVKKAAIPNPTEPGGAALQRVRDVFNRLRDQRPTEARFTPDAARLWVQFYKTWEGFERTGLHAAATKRIHVYVRKLAMVYAAMDDSLPDITLDQLKAAIAVGMYGSACAQLLVDQQHATSRPEGQLEQRVLDWVRGHDGSKKRYMQQTLSKAVGSCEVFNRIVLSLTRAELIEVRDKRVYLSRG